LKAPAGVDRHLEPLAVLWREFPPAQNNLDESKDGGQGVSNLVGGEREQTRKLGVGRRVAHAGIL
jgi:hypothetical protein